MYCQELLCWQSTACSEHNSSRTYKAICVKFADGLVKLETQHRQVPIPGPNDVLIRVCAASLNYRDQVLLEGKYPATTTETVPLSDGAGEVVAVGKAVSRVKIGDRVVASCNVRWVGGPSLEEHRSASLGFTADGWLAENIMLNEDALVLLPDYLSYIEGASLACAAVTAWTALHTFSMMRPGQTILVQGTGGVSLFALQIARMYGARVLAITSSDDKAQKLKELGAAEVVNYSKQPEWERDILAWTDGKGVDKVVEIAGEKTIAKSAASTRIRGEIAVVGFASGFGGGLAPMTILQRSLLVAGSAIGPRLDFEALLTAMAVSKVKPVIDSVFAFADYAKAYERLKSGQHVGKIVIDLTR